MTQPVLAIAHRGGNSLSELRAATQLPADVIECDVHHYRGRLEVRHLKTAGPLPFLWDRWEVRSASAPRLGLAELLLADEHGSRFMLDLKTRHSRTALAVARLLHDLGLHREVLVCGRYWPSVVGAAALPYVRPVLSARTKGELAKLRSRLHSPPSGDPATYGVSVHRTLLDATVVAWLHQHVEVVMTWPVNDTATLDAMLAAGVTGIISDEQSVLADLLERRGG
ncbi:glycerophosphodiester phosphodiesterase [Nocardioides sp.]|uniref:glycerophosphodiester phosphodiesterase n=1 Tax=Nocardioides sp. TaxID=35761 RepID=UPI002733FE4B|nr:glycerophosphodiester phosphodiesterase [Nocardioides sp.]MDP3894994.1 glycerophosphodiester phosphodiesterase [Nocardioides sp.]